MRNGQVKGLLRELDLRAKKSLGQHFLVDRSVLRNIIKAAEITADDVVIEVGPGLGVLTEALAKKAGQVIAVEIDERLASALQQRLTSLHNVSIINADILKATPTTLLRNATGITNPDYKMVANLPYYVASPVMRHFLESPVKPSQMTVMLQKEVGEAIAARSGKMSLLAVSVHFYGKPSIKGYVSARSFYPPPKVDSLILHVDIYGQPLVEVENEAEFFSVVRAGFSAPRKQLRNALAQGLSVASSESRALLERAGINSQRRAETLSVQEWAAIYRTITDHELKHRSL